MTLLRVTLAWCAGVERLSKKDWYQILLSHLTNGYTMRLLTYLSMLLFSCSFVLIICFSDIAEGWQTVGKIAATVAEPKYSKFLINDILSKNQGVKYDRSLIQLELIGLGALTLKGSIIEVSSPLIRTILLKSVVSPKKYNFKLLPLKKGLLDVPELIRYVVLVHIYCPLTSIQEYTPIRPCSHAKCRKYIVQAKHNL